MSIESDEDRLDIVRTLGGIERDQVTIRHPRGQFDAIFDDEYYEAGFGSGPAVEGAQSVLTARSIDVQSLTKDTPLDVTLEDGTVRQFFLKRVARVGGGFSLVFLKR